MSDPSRTMPTFSRDNEVLAAVVSEHGLSQAEIANGTGISASFISRCLTGQYSIPPAVLRYLWARTRDDRVARVALGDRLDARPADQRLAAAVRSCQLISRVGEGLSLFAAGKANPHALTRDIDLAIRSLRVMRSHLQTSGTGFQPVSPVDIRA